MGFESFNCTIFLTISSLDPILIRDEIMSLLVAGRDTVRNMHSPRSVFNHL